MSRRDATQAEIQAFLHELGRRFKGTGALYLVGGSMLVYQGYRPRTVDVDYRFESTSGDDGLFVRALRETQRIINLNVEPASPVDFIPLPAGWRDRSPFLVQEGGLTVYAFIHFPLLSQKSSVGRNGTSMTCWRCAERVC